MTKRIHFAFAILLIAFFSCNQSSKKENPTDTADIIYYGGDILTMEGENPHYVEAIAIKNGKSFLQEKKQIRITLKERKQ